MTVLQDLLQFLDAPVAASWTLTPEQALDFLKSKGLKASFDYRDIIGAEHARSFTVAKMMDTDLLADVKASLDEAIAKGVPFKEWSQSIIPTLQAKGWWGKQAVTDPLTGATIEAGLGSPSRLQTIYRTNMQSAYAAGAWDAIELNADDAPYLLYDAVDDYRTRPEHAAWDGTVLPVSDPFWQTHYPPNGWNCRCSVIQLSEEELADLGLEPSPSAPDDGTYQWKNPRTGKTQTIPKGLDPGWNTNAGVERAKQLAQQAADKVKGYPADLKHAAAKGLQAAAEAGKAASAATAKALARSAAQSAAQALKAESRIAQAAIDKALADKTPFLAKAIQEVKATKGAASMSPKALLDAAKAKAAKTEQNVGLYTWKTAYAAGKTPPAKAQAVFDALPADQQLAIKGEIDVAKAAAEKALADEAAKLAAEQAAAAAAAEQAAQAAAIDKITALQQGTLVEKAAATKATAALASGTAPVQALASALEEIATVKASQAAAGVKSALKKSLVSGKIPSPQQQAFLEAMEPEAKAKFLAEVDKAKGPQADQDPITGLTPEQAAPKPAAKAPAAAAADPETLDTSGMTQIGPQKGSNAGGLYLDPATGEQWYIKTPASLDHARNEVLASKLYRLAGAQVPELRLTTLGGKPAVASRFELGLEKGTQAQLRKAPGAYQHFATDAWLGNWDVAGATMDNLLLKGGQAFRVDVGGSLRYRAQGGAKGAAWSDSVAELDSLRDASTNPQTAKVFSAMTREQMQDSARTLLAIDRDAVDALVEQYGPLDIAERNALRARLRARLDDIGRKLEVEAPKPAPAAPAIEPGGKRVTKVDFQNIQDARANGYTISTDGGDIEDHQVVLQHFTDPTGKRKTRLVAKLRAEGAARANTAIGQVAKGGPALLDQPLDLSELRQASVALGKSINSRAAKSAAWDATIDARIKTFLDAAAKARAALQGNVYEAKAAKAATEHLDGLVQQYRTWSKANGPGKPLTKIATLDVNPLADVKRAPLPAAKAGPKPAGIQWATVPHFRYQLAKVDRGHMTELGATNELPSVRKVYEGTDADGSRFRYIADDQANSISSRGLVHIDVDGDNLAAADLAVSKLEALGVTVTRTTEGQRLGLYLDKIANLRGFTTGRTSAASARKLRADYAKLEEIKDEAARNAAKLKLLNADVGYDLTKSPHWNPTGTRQAFGHGRTLQMRPDLDGPDMAAFEKATTVYTNVTGLGTGASSEQWNRLLSAIDGGGMLSSQMERARRGIASTGSSVSADHSSGGANYVFTRLKPRTTNVAGVYFKPSIMRRVDAVTYDSDNFGRIDASTQASERRVTPEAWTGARGRGGNETIFRDGLSLFDDLERIVFKTAAERTRAIADMKARGYTTWPDGRPLETVLQVAK